MRSKRLLRRFVGVLMITILLMPFVSVKPSLGQTKPELVEGFAHFDEKYVRHTAEAEKLELQAQYERNKMINERKVKETGQIGPMAIDPGIGSTRIIISGWSSGYVFGPDDEEQGIANYIWNNGLTILGWFSTTAGGVLIDVSQMLSETWYRHEYSSFVNTAGYTRTATRDYTWDLGYSAFRIQPSPNYNDNSQLEYLAWYRWYYGYAPGLETY